MTDTVRTVAALQALLADNQVPGSITPQDIRDMLLSGVSVVADNTARSTLHPSPASDARVFNKASHQLERYDSTRAAWIAESISPVTDTGKYGTLPPLPGAQRLVGMPGFSQIDIANNRALGQPLCATATTTSQVKTTNQVDFSINGQIFRKTATDNFWTLTGGTVAISSWQKWLLLVDSAGAATVLIGSASTASAAAVILPSPPAGKAIFGVLTVATTGSTTFVPGTTLLGAAGITATFVDGLDPLYAAKVTSTAPSIVPGALNGSSLIAGSRTIATTDGISILDPNAPFRYFGAATVVSGGAHDRVTAATMGGGGTPNLWGAEWEIDCTSFEFRVQGNGTNGAYKLMVDGVYANDITQLTGSATYYLVTFPTRGIRRIRLELNGGSSFISLAVAAADNAWLPMAPAGPKVICYGDSVPGGTGATFVNSGYVATLGNLMGWRNITGSGSGGTGFLVTGGKQSFLDRLQADCIALSPDIIIVAGSTNDVAAAASIQAAATTMITQIRASLPNTKIIFIARYYFSGTPDQYTIDYKNAMSAALALDTGPHLFVDNIGATVPGANLLGWITGTGKVGATTGSGNADIYISSDGVHPTQNGHDYFARRLASAIAAGMPF